MIAVVRTLGRPSALAKSEGESKRDLDSGHLQNWKMECSGE